MKRAAIRYKLGSPPANTVSWLPGVLGGLRGLASAVMRCVWADATQDVV